MSGLDLLFHLWLTKEADPGTGIVWVNAVHLAHALRLSRSLTQKHLIRLERGGYIKRFAVRRSSKFYPILVNRFHCTKSPHKGMELNATATVDYRVPVYSSRTHASKNTSAYAIWNARAETLILDIKPTPKPGRKPPRPPSPQPGVREQEQRRKVGARDERLQREHETRIEAHVGAGPDRPLVLVGCVECKRELTSTQLNRCLVGKPPAGPGSECPRNPKKSTGQVSTPGTG
jgi:hypothetical protein